MNKVWLCLVLMISIRYSFAQNRVIDDEACLNWPKIDNRRTMISDNGEFVMYQVSTEVSAHKMMLISTIDGWEKELGNISDPFFTEDNQFFIFNRGKDSLYILDLNTKLTEYINHVGSYKISNIHNTEWLAYTLNANDHILKLKNLHTKKEWEYPGIVDYFFNNNKNALILKSSDLTQGMRSGISWIDLNTMQASTIFTGNEEVNNIIIDEKGEQLAFMVKSSENAIYYYKTGMTYAELKIDHTTPGMENLILDNKSLLFKNDDQSLLFFVRENSPLPLQKASPEIARVDIWNFKEKKSSYENNIAPINKYMAGFSLTDSKAAVKYLQNKSDMYIPGLNYKCNNYVILLVKPNDSIQDFYLVSIKNGSRHFITRSENYRIMISPAEKYVIWYDAQKANWFTYRIADGSIENITKKITEPLYADEDGSRYPGDEGLIGWGSGDSSVYIYDRYDLWEVNIAGKNKIRNITGGFGKFNHIRLRSLSGVNPRNLVITPDSLILTALNTKTQEKGFYRLHKKEASYTLTPLTMGLTGSYFPSLVGNTSMSISGFSLPLPPFKAKKKNAYVLERMTANQYPNLYFTTDFVHYKQLTNFEPQKEFRWYTDELIRWKLPDGSQTKGVLFKPKDFNPNKKYPVIFYYYEKPSAVFNLFIHPELSNGVMNIPWFISREYLVFVPDIKYKIGFTGECAYNTVVSAANYLSQNKWIDKNRMGLQGHSYGGWETNYIISRSGDLFKAAASSSGVVNMIAEYGQPGLGLNSKHNYYKFGQGRMGANLWKIKERYIANSPIMNAEKIQTPLLIMHNKLDGAVNWSNAFEMFTALSGLGKEVYMLQYDGEDHTISKTINQLDYTTRLTQFFDVHLKNKPQPVWMSKGLPAYLKGFTTGFELDSLRYINPPK
jgi:dienelactone hydrolase